MNTTRTDPRIRVLEAATRRFAEQGFRNSSLAEVAADVGITRSAVLYHFASKDLLRQAVLDRVIGHWMGRLPDLIRTIPTGSGRFEAIAWEVVHFFTEDRNRARLVVREMLDRPEEMRSALSEQLQPFVTLVTSALRKGQEEGVIRSELDPENAVMHATHLLVGGIASYDVLGVFSGTDDEAFERYVTELVRFARAALFVEN